MWKGIPSITFKSYGGSELYHVPGDNLSIINPEIIEAMSQLLFLTTVEITTADSVKLGENSSRMLFVPAEIH